MRYLEAGRACGKGRHRSLTESLSDEIGVTPPRDKGPRAVSVSG